MFANGYSAGDYAIVSVPALRQIVDVGAWQNSRSQHTTGQSGQPFSKHYDDMIQPWEAVEHHAMLYEKDDIVANQEGLLILVTP